MADFRGWRPGRLLIARVEDLLAGAATGLVDAAGGLGGFFPPILARLVRDADGACALGFMLLSEVRSAA